MKLIIRSQRLFIHARRRVAHSGRVRRVHLERSVVRRDQRPRPTPEKIRRHGHGQRRALLGIGGRAQFIQQHQRALAGQPRKPVQIRDVRGKCRERGFDRLCIADVGQERREHRKVRGRGRHRNPRLCHHRQKRRRLQRYGFAAGIRPADDQLPLVGGQLQVQWNNLTARGAQSLLQKRMAAAFNLQ